MSNQPDHDASTGSTASRGDTPDLMGELRELGQQFEAVYRAALESDHTKQLQRDLAGGVRELNNQVRMAIETLQTHPRVQQAEERGRQVLSQAQQSKTAQEVQETVVSGISQLNEQLRKLVRRLEQDRAVGESTSSQNVPVDPDPTTGDTTRLE